MLCPVILVTYEIVQKGGSNRLESRYFPKLSQAEFYYNTKLEHLKKTYKYILERVNEENTATEVEKTGFPWHNITGGYSDGDSNEDKISKWWVLSNPLAGVSYTLRLTNTIIELDGPEYCRLEEIICNLVDYLYEYVGSTEETNEVLRNTVGLDDYEMDLFAIPLMDDDDPGNPDGSDDPDASADDVDSENYAD